MCDDRKREKTRRDEYSPLDEETKPKKALIFGKKSKVKKKKLKKIDEITPPAPSVTNLFGDNGVFGVPLSVAVSRMPSHDGVHLPVVVRQCIDYVNDYGLEIEGIYRISSPKSRLDQLEDVANSRRPITLNDVHEAAGLLKRFLRKLPDNILTDQMRTTFEKIAGECPCRTLPICRCLVADMLKAQLSKLPLENYTLLAYLFVHAQQVVAHRQHNKMGVAALGLLLQAALNISQLLTKIFLLNASDLLSEHRDSSVVYLFSDVEIKRYVAPKDPKSFNDANLPDCEAELVEEESKQRSSLNQLHQEIEELREMNVTTKEKEEEMWDVQTAITLLNRKLKSLRGRRSESVERNEECDDGPTLEMFEEKQLLATCTELHEEIARYKADIIALENKLLATSNKNNNEQQGSSSSLSSSSSHQQIRSNDTEITLNEAEQSYWRNECGKQEKRRAELVEQIAAERRQCCLLKAKLELCNLKQPTLLVTRF